MAENDEYQCGSGWEDLGIKNNDLPGLSGLGASLFDDALGQARQDEQQAAADEQKRIDALPGAMNAGWNDYYEWANKDYSAWKDAFDLAECERIRESRRWLAYYNKVYNDDWGTMKKLTLFALNAVQLWALWKQFRQQKEIADRTYEIADRQQKMAEEIFEFYKSTYLPHEIALGEQIQGYFDNPYCADYEGTGDQFENNVKNAFARAKAGLLACTSQFCGAFTQAKRNQWEVEKAQAMANARNGAFRYEELRKDTKDSLWLEMRNTYIKLGNGVRKDGQGGILNALKTFQGFGADPGAALNQLLSTFSNTMGQLMNSGVAPTSNFQEMASRNTPNYLPFFAQVQHSGDLQVAKATKPTRSY